MAHAKKIPVPAIEKKEPMVAKIKKNKTTTKGIDKVKKELVKSEKETLREEIAATLQKTFPDIKKAVGEKKFNKHVKKATKVLAGGATKKIKDAKKEKVASAD